MIEHVSAVKKLASALGILTLLVSGVPSGAAPTVAANPVPKPAPQAAAAPVAPASPAVIARAMGGLTAARVGAHVFKPQNIVGAVSDDGTDTAISSVTPKLLKPQIRTFDATTFATELDGLFKSLTVGYAMQIRKDGVPLITKVRPHARTPENGGTPWTLDTRMHIASVSKLITAMATAHVLAKKKLPLDTRIMRFLPRRWSPGPNIDTISFRDLLTNRSGFTTGGSASDYETMKWWVDKGVAATGNYDYENMNFGLCRILIPVVNGDIAEDFVFPPPMDSDKAWDATTIEHYKNYVQQAVFTPAGVSNASFAPLAPTEALAYAYPAGAGWDSGDLATMSGGAGWRLSVNELLRVMDAFRRKGTIVSPTEAQAFLEAGLGLDSGTPTPVGKVYVKNGRWRNGGRTEQTVAFFLPQNMELVVFVNSPIGVSGESLRGLVKTLYLNNLI